MGKVGGITVSKELTCLTTDLAQRLVFDVTKYAADHPGGADVLNEVAGKDATVEREEAGYSNDAAEIMQQYLVGKAETVSEYKALKPVRPITQQSVPASHQQQSGRSIEGMEDGKSPLCSCCSGIH